MTESPEGWEVQRLDDIAEVRLGRQRSPGNHSGTQMRPYLRAANVTWAGLSLDDLKEMNFTDAEMSTYRLEPGDILLSEASGSPGEVGKPAMWNGELADCAFQNTLLRVRPRLVDGDYLLQYFRHLALSGAFSKESRGVGIHHLGRAALAAVEVPLPPIDEQRRIVAVLEDHLCRLDAAMAGVAHSRSLGERAWRSFLAEVLARARKVGQAKVLGEISTTRLGKMLDAKRNSGILTPYLRNQNVQWRKIDAVDLLQVPLSSEESLEFAIVEGDLLVCEGGEPGRCAVVTATPDGPLAFQKALHRVRVHDGVDPHFLQLTLEALAVTGGLAEHFTGTTIKHLPQERLRALTIWVPDKVAQDSIVEEASSLRLALDRLLCATQRARRQAEALRRSVLNAAFSGQFSRESISV